LVHVFFIMMCIGSLDRKTRKSAPFHNEAALLGKKYHIIGKSI